MLLYAVRRLLAVPFILLGVSVVLFLLTHIMPGDPAKVMAGEHASPKTVEIIRQEFGLDKPLPEQYRIYITNLLHGNLGISIVTHRRISEDISMYFMATMELTIAAMLLTVVMGVPLGILSATKKDTILDHLLRFISLSGVSLPVFWLALVLQLILYRQLNLLPIGGRLDVMQTPPPMVTGLFTVDSLLALDFRAFGETLRHLALPAFTLAFSSLAVVSRMTRSSMLEILSQDYIRTAQAKGLAAWAILYRHALRNAAIPTLTVIGLQAGVLLSGAFLIEAIFNWPGLGLYTTRAITRLDYPAIMGTSLLITLVFILLNLVVDLLYGLADPRIRY
ncbi:ABC transporter permease [Chloroflexota bacterium]